MTQYNLKVKLITEGNFYVEADSFEEAKRIVEETNFLNRKELANKYFPLEYKKELYFPLECGKELQEN